jgi:predicted RNA-binding protein with RPS1 domain
MSPFTPTGERARWRVLYDMLAERDSGDTLTYEEMVAALGLSDDDRNTAQLAMRRAATEYETTHKRAVKAIANVGYRIVDAGEHLGLARTHQGKASRSVKRGLSKVTNVDLNRIDDPEVRKALELAAAVLSHQDEMMRRMSIKQAHMERALNSVTERTEQNEKRTADQISQLQERLRSLEERL